MRETMAKAYDAAQARGEQAGQAMSIPTVPAKNIDEAFENTRDWMAKSEADKAVMTEARAQIEQIKANAKQFGVELSDTEALKLQFQLDQQQAKAAPAIPAELQASMQAVKELYGDTVPFHQAAQRYAEIDKLVRSDPVQGLAWIAEQSGLNPLQLAQQLALRYGDQTVVMQNAEALVSQYFESNPDAKKLEEGMLKAIESGQVKRTGHIASDLHRAFQFASKQQRKSAGKPKSMETRMREVYDSRKRG